MITLGIDTSNYTTSIAWFDGVHGRNCSALLPVQSDQLGLRQSDAVFAHLKGLPELSGRLFSGLDEEYRPISAIGVSTRPRAVEGSYMPCFLAGYSHAKLLADTLNIPLIPVSHQQGHVAAALWSAGRLDLMEKAHLAWHLSGGTTELLYVEPDNGNVKCTRIGGTSDISAGQLIDRTGQMLGLGFPSGKALDKMSCESTCAEYYRVKCSASVFSFSGLQNKVQEYYRTHDCNDTARYTMNCIIYTIVNATNQALRLYPGMTVVFSGGVASNSMLRNEFTQAETVFADPMYSTDNAMGPAVLAARIAGK